MLYELTESFEEELPSWIDAGAVLAWLNVQSFDESEFSQEEFEEAYAGEFRDDEDFAEDMADQLGLIDHNASWPQNCIDWERAASELMYDYVSENGYYFRNV